MIHPPPISTLFPYTTLFRSAFYYVPSADSAYTTVAYVEKVVPAGSWLRALHFYGSQLLPAALVLHLDRKSTRLNSSHANISYAVFCLKKKKKNTAYTISTRI